MFNTSVRDSAYLQTLTFLSAAFLFLIVFGAGLGIVGARMPDMVRSGEMTAAAAWCSLAAGIAIFIFLAVFMAHHLILFINVLIRNDRRAAAESVRSALRDA